MVAFKKYILLAKLKPLFIEIVVLNINDEYFGHVRKKNDTLWFNLGVYDKFILLVIACYFNVMTTTKNWKCLDHRQYLPIRRLKENH
jgi:hypothetical protein